MCEFIFTSQGAYAFSLSAPTLEEAIAQGRDLFTSPEPHHVVDAALYQKLVDEYRPNPDWLDSRMIAPRVRARCQRVMEVGTPV